MKAKNGPACGRASYRCALMVAVAAGLATAHEAGAQAVRYTVKDLGALPGATSVFGRGVNNAGDAVGRFFSADGQVHGFVWHQGTMVQVKSLGKDPTEALAINKDGLVVGSSLLASGEEHGFVRKTGQT